MLSSDILTEFRGRGDEVRIFPLSFKEFYAAKGGDKHAALNEYMLFGGMPLVLNRPSPESKIAYLKQLFGDYMVLPPEDKRPNPLDTYIIQQ